MRYARPRGWPSGVYGPLVSRRCRYVGDHGVCGAPLGIVTVPSGPALVPPWGRLVTLLGPVGPPCDHLGRRGSFLGSVGPPCARRGAVVGPSLDLCDSPGTFGAVLGPLGPSWDLWGRGDGVGGRGRMRGAAPSPQASQQDCSEPGHPHASPQRLRRAWG